MSGYKHEDIAIILGFTGVSNAYYVVDGRVDAVYDKGGDDTCYDLTVWIYWVDQDTDDEELIWEGRVTTCGCCMAEPPPESDDDINDFFDEHPDAEPVFEDWLVDFWDDKEGG